MLDVFSHDHAYGPYMMFYIRDGASNQPLSLGFSPERSQVICWEIFLRIGGILEESPMHLVDSDVSNVALGSD